MNHLEILEEAISDVGYWRWWAADLPSVFQVEFGGVQLWTLPEAEGKAPSGVYALRFEDVEEVVFLTEAGSNLEDGWPSALHEDRIEPFNVAHEHFTLTSRELAAEIQSSAVARTHFRREQPALGTQHVSLAFRADDAGLLVRAARMSVLSASGPLSPEGVEDAYRKWWSYWKEYWAKRGSDHPMPKDYACEVTIPLKT